MAQTKVTDAMRNVTQVDAAKITTGTIPDARIQASAVTAHVDLTSVHQGIATLGLHVGVADNKVAYNLPNSFIDIFQDDTGITTETTVDRNASEYVSTEVAGTTNATGTLISDVQTAPSAVTELSGVILYTDDEGTNTLGTDLKIYFTANNGSNWTEASSYGATQTFSGSIKQVKLGKTTVTSGTQVAIKAVWANQVAGVSASGLYQDASSYAHTVTAVANATTSTSVNKVGTTSLHFPYTSTYGDWFTIPDGDWADIGTGDFTMEAWMYVSSTAGVRGIIGSGNFGGPTTYDWSWDMNMAGGANTVRFDMYNGVTEAGPTSSTQIVNDTWTHLAVVRSGGTIKQYFNGTVDGNTLSSTHNIQSHGVVYLGMQSRGTSGGFAITGYMDEIRISDNARYTGNFTDFGQGGGTVSSPTAFTSDSNTLLLVHGEVIAGVTGKVAQLNGWAVNY